nr:unnamed protein product [Callosobruchus chinensis]
MRGLQMLMLVLNFTGKQSHLLTTNQTCVSLIFCTSQVMAALLSTLSNFEGETGLMIFEELFMVERDPMEDAKVNLDKKVKPKLGDGKSQEEIVINQTEPVTTLLGGPEMYINKGSTMNLTCIVKHSPEPPPSIYWTHNGQDAKLLVKYQPVPYMDPLEPSLESNRVFVLTERRIKKQNVIIKRKEYEEMIDNYSTVLRLDEQWNISDWKTLANEVFKKPGQ